MAVLIFPAAVPRRIISLHVLFRGGDFGTFENSTRAVAFRVLSETD